MTNLTQLPAWQALQTHHKTIASQHMRDWFAKDPHRFQQFSLEFGDILLDYSRQRLTKETLSLLCQLAEESQLKQKIAAMFQGEPINHTEQRAVLHTALRDKTHRSIFVNGQNVAPLIQTAQTKMRAFTEQIHRQTWRGVTGKPIQHIVNIGIGGSYLGPKMAILALKEFAQTPLQFHFLSCVDSVPLYELWQQIDPETTLFIISSKSFTTIETWTNARTILEWMKATWGEAVLRHHFIAMTAVEEKARAFGIPEDNIFPLWDWVGGRFSIWSAIGLPLLLTLGEKHYDDFLSGAHAMDRHFQQADFSQNMPVIMALLDIWYVNFFGATSHAIVPYTNQLRELIAYLQQAEMESNGKRNAKDGHLIQYASSPIIFGESGCNGQHSYYQLLHQGQHFIPLDFILLGHPAYEHQSAALFGNSVKQQHDILTASALSQAQALMRGKTYEEAYDELMATHKYTDEQAQQMAQHRVIPGNKPTSILFLSQLTPYNLGSLIALYEHKIFTAGVIWDVNSFDQWGVELGKQLLPTILNSLHQNAITASLDCATEGLIHHYQKLNKHD